MPAAVATRPTGSAPAARASRTRRAPRCTAASSSSAWCAPSNGTRTKPAGQRADDRASDVARIDRHRAVCQAVPAPAAHRRAATGNVAPISSAAGSTVSTHSAAIRRRSVRTKRASSGVVRSRIAMRTSKAPPNATRARTAARPMPSSRAPNASGHCSGAEPRTDEEAAEGAADGDAQQHGRQHQDEAVDAGVEEHGQDARSRRLRRPATMAPDRAKAISAAVCQPLARRLRASRCRGWTLRHVWALTTRCEQPGHRYRPSALAAAATAIVSASPSVPISTKPDSRQPTIAPGCWRRTAGPWPSASARLIARARCAHAADRQRQGRAHQRRRHQQNGERQRRAQDARDQRRLRWIDQLRRRGVDRLAARRMPTG